MMPQKRTATMPGRGGEGGREGEGERKEGGREGGREGGEYGLVSSIYVMSKITE